MICSSPGAQKNRMAEQAARLRKEPIMAAREKNIEVMLEVFRAIERRDQRRMFDLVHSDAEFLWPPSLPYAEARKPKPLPPARKLVAPKLRLTTDGPVRRTSLTACQPTGWGDPTTFSPAYPDHFQIFLDRDSNHVVILDLILSHHLSRASRDPARTIPQAASLRNLCVLRVSALDSSSLGLTLNLQLSTFNRVSFPSSHLSLSQRSCNSFTIRTSKTSLPQLLYNPHLQVPLGSAGNKGLITPLESALTKNYPVTSLESALAERWGVGVRFAVRSPRALPLTLAPPQHTIPPFRRSRVSRTLSAGAIA